MPLTDQPSAGVRGVAQSTESSPAVSSVSAKRPAGEAGWGGGAGGAVPRPLGLPMHALPAGEVQSKSSRPEASSKVRTLAKCGGKRIDEQIDLEYPPGDYVEKLVAVLREVTCALADDGTLWGNSGGTYAGAWGAIFDAASLALPFYDAKENNPSRRRSRREEPFGQLLSAPIAPLTRYHS